MAPWNLSWRLKHYVTIISWLVNNRVAGRLCANGHLPFLLLLCRSSFTFWRQVGKTEEHNFISNLRTERRLLLELVVMLTAHKRTSSLCFSVRAPGVWLHHRREVSEVGPDRRWSREVSELSVWLQRRIESSVKWHWRQFSHLTSCKKAN